jgi:hypothetical protein
VLGAIVCLVDEQRLSNFSVLVVRCIIGVIVADGHGA